MLAALATAQRRVQVSNTIPKGQALFLKGSSVLVEHAKNRLVGWKPQSRKAMTLAHEHVTWTMSRLFSCLVKCLSSNVPMGVID